MNDKGRLAQGVNLIKPQGIVNEHGLSMMEIVGHFEGGAECLYLVDEQGRYRWRGARRENTRILRTETGGWTISFEPVPPLVFDLPINEANLPQLQAIGELMFQHHPELAELPIVDSGGAIVSLARIRKAEQPTLPWRLVDANIDGVALMPKGRLYLASRKSKLLAEFYEIWFSRLDLEYLSEENYAAVFRGETEGTLVYEHDFFPDCPKASVQELYQRLHEAYYRSLASWFMLRQDFASVAEEEASDISVLMAHFDSGYEAVNVQDAKGKYLGTITGYDFRSHFPNPECARPRQLAVNYTGDEAEDKQSIVRLLDGTPYKEASLLKDGKVVAAGSRVIDAGCMDRRGMWQHQRVYWGLISDAVAEEFFRGRQRVLLSSESGDLSGFRERFAGWLDIQVYDGTNYSLYQDGQVDMLLDAQNMWPQSEKTPKYYVRQLYADLLVEDLRRYLAEHGVSFYCVDVRQKVHDQAHRLARKVSGELRPPQVWSGLAEDYYAVSDYTGSKMAQAIGGHRQDAPSVEGYTRSIYLYGPCTVEGYGANFGETVGARLQEACLAAGRKWRSVNCGGAGINIQSCDLNGLNFLAHTHLRRGDVVILCSGFMYNSQTAFPPQHFYHCSDVFDDAEHREGCYFWDANLPGHMTKEGYAVLGRFLARMLLSDSDLATEPESRESISPYFDRLGEIRVGNPLLRGYIKRLASHRRADNGAIVMNANPFTLGHLALVETARREVSFLYVFIVEEDASAIPFQDRLAMARLACAGMDNVEVMPSGRYMISTLTFPEYFEKEALQEQAVLPSQDIVLFGEAIAPTLGIRKRFVGEEPFDKVTRQYNEAMRRLLPDYGVELVEVSRKAAANGTAINATQVREWLASGEFDKCAAYVPETTLAYMKEHDLGQALRGGTQEQK